MSDNRLEEIRNYLQLSKAIATAGQPDAAQFAAIKATGFQVVVNLAMPTSSHALPDEKAIVESQGIQYVPIPVEWENPTLEDFARFVSVMEANTDKPVFVHCALNMRVSAFMYLYRRIYKGVSEIEALQDLHRIWIPNDIWQRFIQQAIAHYQ